MTDDLKERLLELCNGPPNATTPWPHSVIHYALARILDLEARLAAAEAEAEERHALHLEQVRITNEWIARADATKAENTQLKRQVETLKTGWEIADRDRIKAEAGEDALAEALRITCERLMDAVHSEFDGVWSAEDFNKQEAEAVSALAAYEARRKG